MQAVRLEKLPQQLPEGLLKAVHTPEHLAALRATSERVAGPTAVRDPDDPGEGSCTLSLRIVCRAAGCSMSMLVWLPCG
jgi:hypothetical protein